MDIDNWGPAYKQGYAQRSGSSLARAVSRSSQSAQPFLLRAILRQPAYHVYMKLVPDPAAESWLIELTGAAEEFEWDTGNLTKNRKHGVEPTDIQALIGGDFYLAGRSAEPAHEEPRWPVLGADTAGRRLALVFTCPLVQG